MTILTNEKAVCPIDGTQFQYTGLLSHSTFGCGLDGLPLSMTEMPHRIPACPACRFPVWIRDLTDEELETARAVVESPGYEAMTQEAPYLHLEFLLEALGRSRPMHRANNLLKACWQTPVGSERYADYARQLGEATDAASADLLAQGRDNWIAFQTFVANVERQAGMWAEATARLDGLGADAIADERLKDRIDQTRALIERRDGRRVDGEDMRRPLPPR
jgi:hypothetical protein